MRDRETIDSELRRLAQERRFFREHGSVLSSRQLDDLLDERLGHRPQVLVARAPALVDQRRTVRRPSALRRFAFRAAIPLSLVVIAAVLVTMVALHTRHPTARPTATPHADEPHPMPAVKPPVPQVIQLAPHDQALVDVLQHEGVPAPSRDYVVSSAHSVCDFLTRQPDLTEAAHFVQRSTVWDADQSAEVTAAAVVSYCPQFAAAGTDRMQQTLQTSQSTLQAIQGDLQGIGKDLQDIRDGLPGGGS